MHDKVQDPYRGLATSRKSGRTGCAELRVRCNRKVVMIRLVNPVVTLDFHQIRNRGRKLPPAAEEFTSFLKSYIARWAGRAGVL